MFDLLRIPVAATRGVAGALALLLALAGCDGAEGPPRITAGMRCDACGMEIADLRFATARRVERGWRRFDSIECLVRDRGTGPGGAAWLTDYDGIVLHPEDSVWVVRGSFPSPMGGGLAAFRSRSTADSVATLTSGRVDRLAILMPAEARP
jgi:nitrous oxide reductase accessory protein NosL